MSYILEALKKADQERGIGAVPNLATPHEVKHPQSRSYRWLWVLYLVGRRKVWHGTNTTLLVRFF